MIDVQQALQRIQELSHPLPSEWVRAEDSIGRVLAQPLLADADSPPFDKSMMDGYAVYAQDVLDGRRELEVIGFMPAGADASSDVRPGTAIQIMTGAIVPSGADAVIMQEETNRDTHRNSISIQSDRIRPGQNILRKGIIYKQGSEILATGHRVSANDLGLITECCDGRLSVRRQSKVAILATGSEITSAKPLPGQIRNSNGPLLVGLVTAQHAVPNYLGECGDNEAALLDACRKGLGSDVFVLTGGVSTGELDMVPRVLQSLGVQQVFHKLPLKPGKPIWFGVYESDAKSCLVFGLPGNPVSTFVCFQLFVRAGLRGLEGTGASGCATSSTLRAFLNRDHEIRGDRPTYWPSRCEIIDGRAVVEPLDWKGSADQRCLSRANCLAVFPRGDRTYEANSLVEVRWLK